MCISKLSGQVVSARRSFVLQSLSGQLARWIDSCTNSNIIRLTCPLSFTYCNSQHTKAMHRGDCRVPSPFGGKHVRGAHIRSPIYSLPFATHSSNNHATNFQTYISTFSDDQEMQENPAFTSLTSWMVSRTAARAASDSALLRPVFSETLATNSGFLKFTTSSDCFAAFMAMPVDRPALCGAKAEAEAIRSAERRYTNLMVAVMRRSDFRIHLCGGCGGRGRTPDRQMRPDGRRTDKTYRKQTEFANITT